MSTIGSAFVEIRADTSRFAAGAKRGIEKVGPAVQAVGQKALSLGKIAGTALVTIGAFGIKSSASLEQTKTSFTSLLGSAGAANDMLHNLQQFAAATPFEFSDVAGYAQQFLAMHDSVGLAQDQLIPFLKTVGNLGSVTGASTENIHNAVMAIGQIGSKGKITLDNLNQISQAFPGFNATAAIASARGETTAQVMQEISAGTLSAATAVPQLIKGMAQFKGASGAMAKQSQTLNGLLSTFADTVKINLTNSLSSSIPLVKKTLAQITPAVGDALKTVGPAIAHLIAAIGPVLAPLVKSIGGVLTTFAKTIEPVLKGIGPLLAPVADALNSLIVAAQPLLKVFVQIAKAVIPPLSKAIQQIAPVIGKLVSALGDALAPILPVITQLIELLAPVIVLVAKALTQVLAALAPVWKMLAGALMTVLKALAPILPQLVQSFLNLVVAFTRLYYGGLQALLPPLIQLLGLLLKIAGPVLLVLTTALAKITGFLATLAGAVTHVGTIFRAIFNGVIKPQIIAFRAIIQAAWHGVIQPIFHGLEAGWRVLGQGIRAIYNGVIRPVIHAFGAAFSAVWHGVIQPVFHAITSAWHAVVNGIKSFAGSLAGGVKAAFSGVMAAVKTPINWIIDGLNFVIRGLDHIHFSIPSWVPFVGGKGFGINIPQIPHIATGGLTTGAMVAMVGDNPSGNELIMPMDSPQTVKMLASALEDAAGRNRLAQPSHFGGDYEALAREVAHLADALLELASRPVVVEMDGREVVRAYDKHAPALRRLGAPR